MGLFSKKKDEIPEIGSEELGSSEENDSFGTGLENDDDFSFEEPELNETKTEDEGFVYRGRTPLDRKPKKKETKKVVKKELKKNISQKKVNSERGMQRNFRVASPSVDSSLFDLKIEKLETKLESIQEYIKEFSERFSLLNQQIGEVRSSSLSNEKNIAKVSMESSKAVDLVSDVHPEKLRIDYQKLEGRIQAVDEKISMQKEMVSGVLEEFEEFKRKSQVFIGTEGLLKLNEEIQKDLIQVQRLASMVKLNADKCQNIFSEVSHGFAESQKKNELMDILEKNYSGLRKEIENNKLISNNFITKEDLGKMQGVIEAKLQEVFKVYEGYNQMIAYNQNLGRLVQKLFLLHQENEDKLREMSFDDESERLKVLESRMNSLLNIVEKLSSKFS